MGWLMLLQPYKQIANLRRRNIYICHEKCAAYTEDRKSNISWDRGRDWQASLKFGAKALRPRQQLCQVEKVMYTKDSRCLTKEHWNFII